MTNLDRTLTPAIRTPEIQAFSFPEKIVLSNGLQVYRIHDPQCEVVRIELQFVAGLSHGRNNLVPSLTNALITSGTKKWSSRDIVEKLDYYGAYFDQQTGSDLASLTIYSLSKYAAEVISIVSEVMADAVFPEDELETALDIRRQKFLINNEKVSHLARREFRSVLYGKDHVYGRNTSLTDFDEVQLDELRTFFNRYYKENLTIYVSGFCDDKLLAVLEGNFAGLSAESEIHKRDYTADAGSSGKRSVLAKDGALQSAVRIGRLLFNRTHNDFAHMQLLSSVLGGYFGSRLMSNLREDKGYTYGVGAGISPMLYGGYFYIATEVGATVTKAAEKEILTEVAKLREDLISTGELNTVKNYLLGQILRSLDGAFAAMDRFKSFQVYGLDANDFDIWIKKLKTARPGDLQKMADKWLQEKDLRIVIAGKDA